MQSEVYKYIAVRFCRMRIQWMRIGLQSGGHKEISEKELIVLGAEQLDPLIDGAKVHLFTVARSMTRRPINTYIPLKKKKKKKTKKVSGWLHSDPWSLLCSSFTRKLYTASSWNVRQDVAIVHFSGCQRGILECDSRSDQKRTAQRWDKGEWMYEWTHWDTFLPSN